MGRVYDALKRAAEANGAKDKVSAGGEPRAAGNGANGHGAAGDAGAPAANVVATPPTPEQLLGRAPHQARQLVGWSPHS